MVKKVRAENQDNRQNMETVERKTEIQPRPGCEFPLKGCLYTILLICLIGIASNEWKRSKVRLERDKIKLEQLKKDTVSPVKDNVAPIVPDTLKLGKYQQTYIPLLKQFQTQNQKGM